MTDPGRASRSAAAGRDLGSGIADAFVALVSSTKPARDSRDTNCGSSTILVVRTFVCATASAKRSSGCKAGWLAGDVVADAGKKRSSNEEMRSELSGSAADASE